jgi:methyl-accepting chemotaxis protein
MSNQVILTIAGLTVLAAIVSVIKNKLKYKNSILFHIASIMLVPLFIAAISGVIVGARGIVHFLWGAPLILGSATIAYEIISRTLRKPLEAVIQTVESLANGDVDTKLDPKFARGKHEVSLIAKALISLLDTLKKIADFTNHIGKGDLTADYTLVGENDKFGQAMLNMRTNLKKAEVEKLKQEEEESKRRWITQGVAKFSELLRANNDNLETFCYSIISNMVKYVSANQGGIFLLNDSEQPHTLDMIACYAYDRKKFSTKKIELGEGLLGACFYEQQSIYMTNIPHDYITITSGLGEETPGALFIAPLKVNDQIYGVIELAGFNTFELHVREFIEKEAESIAATLYSVKMNTHTAKLLEQTKFQTEEMANAEEELRQNMEEMWATQEEMQRQSQKIKDDQRKNAELLRKYEQQIARYKSIIEAANIDYDFSEDEL